MSDAMAKAKLLTQSMRAASDANVSAQAQGLLAVILGESWYVGRAWTAKLAFSILEERLSAHRASIKRWAEELEQCEIVRRRSGSRGRITTWTVMVGVHGRTPDGAPAQQGGCARATRSGAPAHPNTRTNVTTGRTTTSSPNGSSPPAWEPPRTRPTPESKRRFLERLAAEGSKRAQRELEQLRRDQPSEQHTTAGPTDGQVASAADLQ